MTNEELLSALSVHFAAINSRLDGIDGRLEWADVVGKINKFPIAK